MNVLDAVESEFKSILDKAAYDINVCVKDQSRSDNFEKTIKAIERFDYARSKIEVVRNLKSQLSFKEKEIDESKSDDNSGAE
jgi:hypothetical protein